MGDPRCEGWRGEYKLISALGLRATHSLRSAVSEDEWNAAEEVVAQLAGNETMAMRMSEGGSLLMPPRGSVDDQGRAKLSYLSANL